jgi:hypothetical protein
MDAFVSKVGHAPVTSEADRIKHRADGAEYDPGSAIRNIQRKSALAHEQQKDLDVHCRLVSPSGSIASNALTRCFAFDAFALSRPATRDTVST